jgi:16S rRNA (guanine966-N2)-methyltransferase
MNLPEVSDLRIIGGSFRGRKLRYEQFQHGDDPVTRPMKHRVREAIFNLLSTEAAGRHAVDLFAGTGALGLEALSRGAVSATFIEQHVPTARVIQENITALGVEDRSQLLTTSAFLWARRDLPRADCGLWIADCEKQIAESGASTPAPLPWLVFCSPPYAFYTQRQAEMLELVASILDHAPKKTILVVEADASFDFQLLPGTVAEDRRDSGWQVRAYLPAVVGVWRM